MQLSYYCFYNLYLLYSSTLLSTMAHVNINDSHKYIYVCNSLFTLHYTSLFYQKKGFPNYLAIFESHHSVHKITIFCHFFKCTYKAQFNNHTILAVQVAFRDQREDII